MLTHYLNTDLGGITRGRAAWNSSGSELLRSVGWVPVNQVISPFDTIPSPNPWGSHGDCRLRADIPTLVEVDLPQTCALRLVLCDIADLDGNDHPLCARSFLRRSSAALAGIGLQVRAAFEQEFWLLDPRISERLPGFSYQRALSAEPFATIAMQALEQAGVEPEMMLAEFAPDQFELTMAPAASMVAADRAVVSKEVLRAVARAGGARASFVPVRTAGALGSGTHVHLSLWDLDGKPVTFDSEGTGGLSRVAQSFCAGIVAQMPALCALTASSVVSYERLQPHRWSSAYTCIGDRNREATLRICPINGASDTPAQTQCNVEYRAADATANPYLALGGLLAAGLSGIRAGSPMPPLVNEDPSLLCETERQQLGVHRLPLDLASALNALEGSDVLGGALGKGLLDAFLLAKRHEIAICDGLDPNEVCSRYASIY